MGFVDDVTVDIVKEMPDGAEECRLRALAEMGKAAYNAAVLKYPKSKVIYHIVLLRVLQLKGR